jgi:hypothetical protein
MLYKITSASSNSRTPREGRVLNEERLGLERIKRPGTATRGGDSVKDSKIFMSMRWRRSASQNHSHLNMLSAASCGSRATAAPGQQQNRTAGGAPWAYGALASSKLVTARSTQWTTSAQGSASSMLYDESFGARVQNTRRCKRRDFGKLNCVFVL